MQTTIRLILGNRFLQNEQIRPICGKPECPGKRSDACPQMLVVDGVPITQFWEFVEHFRGFKYSGPYTSFMRLEEKTPEKEGFPDYGLLFAVTGNFYEKASEFMNNMVLPCPNFHSLE